MALTAAVQPLTAWQIPSSLPNLKALVTAYAEGNGFNTGLYLRWFCALRNMEAFKRLPSSSVDSFIVAWRANVESLVVKAAPWLTLVATEVLEDRPYLLGGVNTIVSFGVNVRRYVSTGLGGVQIQTYSLGLNEAKALHKVLLTKGYQGRFVALGQPVQIRGGEGSAEAPAVVLRIALGADAVIQAVQRGVDGMVTAFAEDAVAVDAIVAAAQAMSHSSADRRAVLDSVFPSTAPCAASTERYVRALQALPLKQMPDAFLLHDMDALHKQLDDVHATFHRGPARVLHCFAVKACPLEYVLHVAKTHNFGAEAASLMEVRQAIASGCHPSSVMFDR